MKEPKRANNLGFTSGSRVEDKAFFPLLICLGILVKN